MSIFYVKKNESGTHSQIQAAIYDAVDGDIINIGPGTWYENIELYKSVQLIGSGKDQTIIEGQLNSFSFTNGNFYQGDDIITVSSTANMIKGRRITGSYLASNARISEIINETQFRVFPVSTSGNIAKTAASVIAGSNTIIINTSTSIVAGMKVEGLGINAIVISINATTRVVTLSSPATQNGTNVALTFKPLRNNITITMPSQFSGSTFPGTIQVMNVATNGFVIKNIKIIGFDNTSPIQDAASIAMSSPVIGSHENWLIDNCEIIAAGDQGISTSSNFKSINGTVQNCIFDGQTFIGTEPTEAAAFSTITVNTIVTAVTATTFTVNFSSSVPTGGSSYTSTAFSGSASFANASGNLVTFSKSNSGLVVGQSIPLTFNAQYCLPNIARQMVVIGNSSTVSSCINTTFKNNLIKGKTGAVIAVNGNKSMFNTAVTIDTVGGLIENNTINGYFGAGQPNSLNANFAIRSRRPEGSAFETIIRNNTNIVTGGRGNAGFYYSGSPVSVFNNIEINLALVNPVQPALGGPLNVTMDKDSLKNISKVSSNPIFSNESNWSLVTYVYKQVNGSKRLTCSFKNTSTEVKMKLRSGVLSGMEFELQKIIISKPDRTLFVIKRSDIIDVSTFNFTLN